MSTNYLKYGIGADISMDEFDVCLSVIDQEQRVTIKASRKFSNNKVGFDSLLKWVEKHRKLELPTVFLLEATGVYHEMLSWYLY